MAMPADVSSFLQSHTRIAKRVWVDTHGLTEDPIPLRHPWLIPHILFGLLCGICLWVSPRLSRSPDGKTGGKTSESVDRFMNFAGLFYCGMNSTALFAHIIVQRQTEGWSLWRVMAELDVAFTGASSACLILAMLCHISEAKQWQWKPQVPPLLIAPLLIAVSLAGFEWTLPWVNEVVYIVLSVTAGIAVIAQHTLTFGPSYEKERLWMRRARLVGLLIVFAFPVELFDSAFLGGLLPDAVSLTFLGCNLALLCVWQVHRVKTHRSKGVKSV
uniref:Uncharacterized protein n=1 Tax=Chromera velia CCMP2878 TaxID=1169474 RepID=A0A0G4GRI3_9ALVE|eukprot:Cvel_23076.t1-p1 / transcript=Cvel_23076.t1 / gene=Cvel_23076 / organism=Chromera_velia_CCMP2878 / gene_product=hypothetical protein / transcript_product=hypothetical protein / location=Cvel_scaffold2337:10967-11779(+) / protein_length=271 / sequence_SO=supercontig / SO=protein_coding / is_pseudo=false